MNLPLLNLLRMSPDMKLFWGCFTALIDTVFKIIARVLTSSEWGAELGFIPTQS